MPYLRRIEVDGVCDRSAYPFSVPALARLETLEFTGPVTCFVGENGSGKSTLLEAIALRARLPMAGGVPTGERDETLEAVRPLAAALRLGWKPRTRRGFFLRAEDFFRFGRTTRETMRGLSNLEARFADDARVRGYMRAQREALAGRYGDDPQARSHGEEFLEFFRSRCVPGGLFLLDEPEAALSPQRQLALLSLMRELVEQGRAQFILATHSPLLLAYPQARLLAFDDQGIGEACYDELPHVTLTRAFLADPERYLRHL